MRKYEKPYFKPEPKRERHHRHPKSRKASYSGHINEDRNISVLRHDYHKAYHLLFGNLLPDEMAELLNDVYISPDYYLVAFPRKKKQATNRRKRRWCKDCECVVLQKVPPKD